MSQNKLFCGIDGGGTTTTAVVCDEQGKILGSVKAGSINHYGIGLEKAKANYKYIKSELVKLVNREPDITYIGNSALDEKANDELVKQLTKDIFNNKVLMHSDVYIALLGFTCGAPGALLISGTGSMACAIDGEGNYYTSGGWGHILGDEGSAYHLGISGIQAALQSYDQISPPTILLEYLKEFYQLDRLTDIIETIYNPPVEKSQIAAFAVEVDKAAKLGDKVAIQLIENESEWLFRLSQAILNKSGVKHLGLNGSVLVKNQTIKQYLISKYSETEVSISYPRFRPEIGALFGAFRNEDILLTDEIIANLSNY